ncbi:MAG: metallophosphoesterase family protein [Phycisphaerae bacterium]|nr:metallophosphoesterase family protein [Phycisphaerae bacterium]
MNRRDFFGWSSAALAAGFSLNAVDAKALAVGQSAPEEAPPTIFGGPPVLQSPSSEGITIFQGVRGISTGWVEYGTTKELGQRADTMRHGLLPLNGLVQRVRLENLKSDTTYFYRVGVAPIDFRGAYKITRHPDQFSPVYSFRTLSDSRKRAGFLVINDTHENMDTLRGLSGLLAAARTRHAEAKLPTSGPLFWNGDIFNDVRNDQQIAANVLTPPIASDVPGAELGYASSTPMCFVSGNHDVRGIHARSLDMFVDTPLGLRHAIIRHGPIAFIVLDTGEDKPDLAPGYARLGAFDVYRKRQAEWLEQALRDRSVRGARHRIVIQHIPMWGGGSCEGARTHWAKQLAEAKVTAVISGHTHQYAFTPAGADVPFAQLVGGGPAPESATLIEGGVDGEVLTLTVRGLDGKVRGVHEVKAPR